MTAATPIEPPGARAKAPRSSAGLPRRRRQRERVSVAAGRRRRSNRPGISQAEGPRAPRTLWKAPAPWRSGPPKGEALSRSDEAGPSSQVPATEGVQNRSGPGRAQVPLDRWRATMTDERKTLPLDGWHRRLGARMVPFAGYEMPVQYEGIMAEHLWTRENAGLFDVSHMGQLLIHGAGRRPRARGAAARGPSASSRRAPALFGAAHRRRRDHRRSDGRPGAATISTWSSTARPSMATSPISSAACRAASSSIT